jgi:type II secretory pathway pseudopilin PulG
MQKVWLSIKKTESGYTLIELLLYVVIVAGLLTTITAFFGTITSARVKNQTIAEVNDQGTAVMDYMTRTIRNATSVTSPAVGASGSSLTLVVPTAGLSPTIFDTDAATTPLGYNVDGGTTDADNSNHMNATKFIASTSGTVSTLHAYIGPTVAASPNNKGQMAIYSGTSAPTTLLASSSDINLTANAWNTFPISSVAVTSSQTYWLAYNTNGLNSTHNNLRYHAGTTNQTIFTVRTYGTWPASWTGTGQNVEFSMYASINTGGPSALRVKEGAAAAIDLTGDDVQIDNLTFKNLSRSSTSNLIQISFTLSHVNSSGRNEYDYQKTFTASAELAW